MCTCACAHAIVCMLSPSRLFHPHAQRAQMCPPPSSHTSRRRSRPTRRTSTARCCCTRRRWGPLSVHTQHCPGQQGRSVGLGCVGCGKHREVLLYKAQVGAPSNSNVAMPPNRPPPSPRSSARAASRARRWRWCRASAGASRTGWVRRWRRRRCSWSWATAARQRRSTGAARRATVCGCRHRLRPHGRTRARACTCPSPARHECVLSRARHALLTQHHLPVPLTYVLYKRANFSTRVGSCWRSTRTTTPSPHTLSKRTTTHHPRTLTCNATTQYPHPRRQLLALNPDNYRIHEGLRAALGLAPAPDGSLTQQQRERLAATYAELAKEYPRCGAVQRIPLDFTVGASRPAPAPPARV